MRAPEQSIAAVLGSPKPAALLAAVRSAVLHTLKVDAMRGPAFPNSVAVLDYLRAQLAESDVEQVRLLCLNARNRLTKEVLISIGTVDEAGMHPRDVVRAAIEANATGIIIVHNHPSGDPWPSKKDIQTTTRVWEATRLFGIELHDHIVIGREGHVSFLENGWL